MIWLLSSNYQNVIGKKVVVENFDEPGLTLLNFLRRKLGLCGTKLGCGEGGCGACTVMVSDLQVDEIISSSFKFDKILSHSVIVHKK